LDGDDRHRQAHHRAELGAEGHRHRRNVGPKRLSGNDFRAPDDL
jgi:hypothetical protein